ncbi:hypothetical protein DM867_09110 [Halosegnis rubeus]|uniref:Uncharacterized protein n=1 Tax=Halosegnis rubeus TaxID=2212850 RepID=A0A5N5U644_9EURY|nr:hypothetical protein [Halosegnis rubeus]KAB7513939.1 hypothetical protein DM867_09110 [Halosegnis rubeus]
MTLLDRIQQWLFGTGDGESPESDMTESASEETGEPRLDPDNVSQTRSQSDDDAVSQLQEIKEDSGDEEESPPGLE